MLSYNYGVVDRYRSRYRGKSHWIFYCSFWIFFF